MNIGEALKTIREKRSLTQVEVAKKLKVTQAHVSRIENGKSQPGKAILSKMCKLYKVPPSIPMIMAMEEVDVPKSNAKLYVQLKPAIDSMIDQFLTGKVSKK
jgi:transcriptional regulator with XRE-family HTH domain